ncbi:MAG: TrmO family methyltransferase [Bacillota bacterium]|jgi:hypothetical protein
MEETVLAQYRGQVRQRLWFLGVVLALLAVLILIGITLGSSRLPLAKVAVACLERNGNELRVSGLDALDGTPVLDLNPYSPLFDATAG